MYAATATFLECLTGRKPYDGQNFAELAVQHIEAPVPETEAPEPVRPLIRRGLAKAPEQRPANAEAFVAELEAVALAAYGPQWEERGQRKLAAMAALLPLLFPSAAAPAQGVTALATTVLPPRPPWSPGGRGLLAAGAALVLGLVAVLGYQAVGSEPGGAKALNAFATSSASAPAPGSSPFPTPSASPSRSTGPSPSASPTGTTPSPSASVSGSASASASATPTYSGPPSPTPTPTTSPTPTPTVTPSPSPSVIVSSVSVTLKASPTVGEATVSLDAKGGPVTVLFEWFLGDAPNDLAVADGTDRVTAPAGSLTSLSQQHSFTRRSGCYLTVRASTEPAAPKRYAYATVQIPRCTVAPQ